MSAYAKPGSVKVLPNVRKSPRNGIKETVMTGQEKYRLKDKIKSVVQRGSGEVCIPGTVLGDKNGPTRMAVMLT
jgi:hypothetical protein